MYNNQGYPLKIQEGGKEGRMKEGRERKRQRQGREKRKGKKGLERREPRRKSREVDMFWSGSLFVSK